MIHSLQHSGLTPTVLDFVPYGYDERQYCSPGFNLPVGLFQRGRSGKIPEYHTSSDNLEFIRSNHLARSFGLIAETINVIENDTIYYNTIQKCEPQLGKRGLYNAAGGGKDVAAIEMAMLWILNLSDGAHSLLDIAERADLPFAVVDNTAQLLREHGLLSTAPVSNRT
jgi:aminopeptidase-like protein